MNDILKGWASEDPATEEDLKSAEEDLRHAEFVMTEAMGALHEAHGNAQKAKAHRDELAAKLKDHGTHRKE
jgi:hypothetical protein